ncbi:MAG: helix-hairpin-helix domain-containing protein [Candidatus Poribacteria bacterium]
MMIAMNNNRGLSLIAVLWIVTILTILASEFMYTLQLEVKTSRNWNDQVNAYYSAKGGFETAIAYLRSDETSYDSLDEDWANGFTGELNNTSFNAKMIDESSKINVNTIDEATLTKVIQYCLQQANEELSEAEVTAQAQQLASAIIAKRPFRTTAEMAKAEGMTPDILYGWTGNNNSNQQSNTRNTNTEQQKTIALIDLTTVFSADKNVANDGSKRVNINTADANQIVQGVNVQNQGGQRQGQGQQQQVITQQEAQAIVDYRSQSTGQQGQQGGQTPQGQMGQQQAQIGQMNVGGQQMPTGQTGQQGTNQTYRNITDLLNVPAISQQTLNSIRDRITVDDQQQSGQQGGPGGQQQQRININTASAEQLRNLSDRIDEGIADSIIRYRQNNRFDNVDELLQVRAVSIQDLRVIADRVTTTDDAVLPGKININTVPLELLQLLPGMDETKANAIIAYRESGTTSSSSSSSSRATSSASQRNSGQIGNQQGQGGPFDNIGQLLDVEGIDENTFRQLVDIVSYRSSVFRIEATGTSQDNKIKNGFTAIVDRSGNRIQIKYWKQM